MTETPLPSSAGNGPLPGEPGAADTLLPGSAPIPPMPEPTPADPEVMPLPGEPLVPGPDDAPGGPPVD